MYPLQAKSSILDQNTEEKFNDLGTIAQSKDLMNILQFFTNVFHTCNIIKYYYIILIISVISAFTQVESYYSQLQSKNLRVKPI